MNYAGLQIFCLRVVFFRQLLSYSRGCFFYFFPFLLNLHTILTFPPENLETGILLWRCQKQRGKRNRCLGVKVRRKTDLLYGKEKSMKTTKKAFIAVSMIGFAAMMFSCTRAKTTADR